MGMVQFMALVEEDQRDRMDALRIVMNSSRAKVLRLVLDGESLDSLENKYAQHLDVLRTTASNHGMLLRQYVAWVVDETHRVAVTHNRIIDTVERTALKVKR